MLETTLAAKFTTGANLKGQVAGANWLFLLPSLPLTRVVCIGVPTDATLLSLASRCRDVTVLTPGNQPQQESNSQPDLAHVTWLSLDKQALDAWPDQCLDLVVLVDGNSIRLYKREHWLREAVRRLLRVDGLLYYEYLTPLDPLRDTEIEGRLDLWVTPLHGEVSTIVPVADRKTTAYFNDHALASPSLRVTPLLKRLVRVIRRHNRPARSQGPSPVANGSAVRPSFPRRTSSVSVKSALRTGSRRVLRTLDHAGTTIERIGLHSELLRRTAVLAGTTAQSLSEHPPHYLRQVAAEAGLSLDHHSWGMVAPGDYSSRKLLFFLFRPSLGSTTPTLRYIVKMVRDPAFNARLENERRALTLLQKADLHDHEAVPRVVFAGYHTGLALVGESALEGVPFRSQTQGDADCPYLHQAIEWLTDLGSATASWETTNQQVADALTTLLGLFLQFYRMSPEHHTFLADQIEHIATNASRMPAVFQHGDPGLWNLVITSSGRVAFLDWEAFESAGMPLWDFFHFMRSYSVHAGRKHGIQDSLRAIQSQLWTDTPLQRVAAAAIQTYSERVQLPLDMVEPLFFTCWMHRAIKEASRLPAARLERGHYVSLVRLCIEQRHTIRSAMQIEC